MDNNFHPITTVYRKTTHVDSYINWYSNHSQSTKLAVVSSQILRAFRICSPSELEQELKHIKDIFKNLHYPETIYYKALNKAKKSFYEHTQGNNPVTEGKKKIYINIPTEETNNYKKLLPQNIHPVKNINKLKTILQGKC